MDVISLAIPSYAFGNKTYEKNNNITKKYESSNRLPPAAMMHILKSAFDEFVGPSVKRIKTGPERKLSLEQELLLMLMKLRLALLVDDLAFRFKVSHGSVSSIFITWVKLLSKELSILIIWPSRSQMRNNLPHCFKKLYPKVKCIIDCFECFTDTPSSLDLAATICGEYKHHYTI